MDERDDLYDQIVEEYKKTGSVKKVVENLKSNTIKVRRVLITEGLWESESSRSVGELYRQGKNVKEIAELLCMSEKNVQSYMPYTRGAYGGEKSDDALRSEEYRGRMQKAAGSQAALTEGNSEGLYEPVMEKNTESNIIEFSGTRKQKKTEEPETHRFPGVIKLRMELISPFYEAEPDKGLDLSAEEKKSFLKNAKAKEGIIREVLVPGEMNLHSLHYMLQKLFGWQNSHLHNFFLSSTDFEMVTDNKRVDEYLNLCGTLFRFPGSELDDQFWDDDYEDEVSIKSWLRSKYTYGFVDLAVENSYPRNIEYVKELKTRFKKEFKKNKDMKLDELRDLAFFENGYNVLLENILVRHLFAKGLSSEMQLSAEQWRKFQKVFVLSKKDYYDTFREENPDEYEAMLELFDELLELRKSEVSFHRGMHTGHAADIKKQFGKTAEEIIEELDERIADLEEVLLPEMADGNPQPIPFADSIYYCYDFGDDWTVKITCTDAYISDQNFDWCNPDSINKKTGARKIPKKPLKFVDSEGKEVSGEESARLSEVYLTSVPKCIYADGLNVMDDVGGIYGFCDFLETINGDDVHEAEESRNWAKWMGWTGRKTKPENIL